MVRPVLSKYGTSPPNDGENRKIKTATPINPVDEVLAVLTNKLPMTMTRKSGSDLQNLGFDTTDLKELIEDAIRYGKYRDSEWCTTKDDGPWYACDSYEVKRKEENVYAGKSLEVHYFIKFCINKMGNLICTFSCHLSN